jgi:uncharacterized cupredoxin-like copper-binding protein
MTQMTRIVRQGAVVLLGLALAACGTGASPSPTSMTSEMPMGSEAMETDIGALGEPANAAEADRTIQLTATDELVFNPDTIEVQVGETVTFEIENTGTVDHEFVLGSAAYQEEHEQEMMASPGMAMGEPNELDVPAGETASLTWHFSAAGTTEYGCHEPAHFPAGMVGTITVSE